VSGARKLVVSGIALTTLLALVAVASRAHRPGGGSGGGTVHAPTLIGDYLATLALIAIPIGGVLVVWAMTQRRRAKVLEGKTSWRRTLLALAVLALLLGAAVYVSDRHGGLFRGRGTQPAAPTVPAAPSGKPSKQSKQKPESVHQPHFRWLPVLVVGSVLVGLAISFGAAARQRRRHGTALHEQAALAAALDDVLADTLDDLRAERDPRRAVIRAYARMEKTFAAYGVPREEAEAPLEYLARVLDSISMSAFSVQRLTDLFERAKFSPHAIDTGMKDEAIEALAGVRAELEQGRAAA
jgi:hypothetical protein